MFAGVVGRHYAKCGKFRNPKRDDSNQNEHWTAAIARDNDMHSLDFIVSQEYGNMEQAYTYKTEIFTQTLLLIWFFHSQTRERKGDEESFPRQHNKLYLP